MTQGFYECLGTDPGATAQEVRSAYTRLVTQLVKRRKAVVEQGGDPSPLDLSRRQADEAWKVLSDPVRRRRYDAMLAVAPEGAAKDGNELWRRAAGALVHPAAGSAAELLRVVTSLKVGAMPPVPRAPGHGPRRTAEPVQEVTVTATAPTAVPLRTEPGFRPAASDRDLPEFDDEDESESSDGARVVALPTRAEQPQAPGLRVVDGTRSAPVMVMPSRPRLLSAEDVARLVDQHGYSGALLRAIREARQLSLQDMSDTTRISIRYLEAIEADQHDRLPSSTFVRGYVREMARLLALDEEATVAGYMRRLR